VVFEMNVIRAANKYLKFIRTHDKLRPQTLDLDHLPTIMPKIKPFLFVDDGYFDQPATNDGKINYLPFKFCSFELPAPTLAHDGNGETNGWQKSTGMNKPSFIGQIYIEHDDLSIEHYFVLKDTNPTPAKPEFAELVAELDMSGMHLCMHQTFFKNYEELNADKNHNSLLRYVNLRRTHYGLTRPIEFKRTGLAPDFVKRIIVIGSSKISEKEIEKTVGEPIDWKHQWRVRGHWRKISDKMIGKDREGAYCIVGRTWVKDFVKGDGPLIEKTRIIKGAENEWSKQSNIVGSPWERPRA
jgi:hypothetical protein